YRDESNVKPIRKNRPLRASRSLAKHSEYRWFPQIPPPERFADRGAELRYGQPCRGRHRDNHEGIPMQLLRTAVTAAALLTASFEISAAADATGTWLTEDGKARVRIAACGAALCGTVISLKEPNDPQTGRPKTDKNNADAGLRARPMIGVQIVLGMKPSGTA